MFKRLFIFFIWLFFISNAFANSTENHAKSWNTLNITGDFCNHPKWHYLFETHLRLFSDNDQFFDESVNIAGLGYSIVGKTQFWLGYYYILSNSLDGLIKEQRIWYQLSYPIFSRNEISLTGRSRVEQRMRDNASGTAWRFRQRITLTMPFLKSKKCKTVLYEELFLNLNKPEWISVYTVNQNRFFAGVRFPIAKKTNLQIGYLNQYVFRNEHNNMNHILSMGIYIRFN